ncbi:MAG: hypothetical protein NTX22_07735 [Ignavibacteriales bacterium]|nr:hypothetical protein [Ignavibacteriales bacterium]
MSTKSYYKEIIDKIDNLSKREYSALCLMGVQLAAIGIIQIFIALAFLEMLGNFSSGVRTIFILFFLIISFGLISYLFIIPILKYFNLFNRKNYFEYAKKVGGFFPIIKDDLLNAMQLVESSGKASLYSTDLRDAAFQQVYHKTQSINFADVVSFEKAKKLFKFFILAITIGALLIIFVPGLNAASFRLFNFNKDFIPPAKFGFIIIPGNKEITKGQELNISAHIIGPKPSNVSIGIKNIEQTDYEFKNISSDSTGIYSFNIPAVRSTFNYLIKAEDVESENYKITVIDRPIIKNMDVTVIPPSYSKLPTVNQKDNGNVTSLVGSQIQFFISTTKENLKSAKLFFKDSSDFQLKLEGRNALGTYRIKKDEDYKIILTDKDNNQNENPVTYSIKALTDGFPSIEIIAPNKNISLGEDDRLPLLLKVSDDFGFNKLLLHYRMSSSKKEKTPGDFSSVEIPLTKTAKEEDINYIWNLSPLQLAVEDVVTYYLEIFDNDFVSGPKSTKTGTFTVRVPSLDELFKDVDKTHDDAEKKLAETLNEAKKLKENLEKINQDLKQDKKEITWQEKEQIEKALDKFDELGKKIDDVKKDMSKMQDDMQKNNLLSKETLQKYMELQKLFDELGNEEMKKAMEKMQELLQNLNRDQIQKAMENMQFNEEAMKKSIERTMQLLKRVQIEQKLDEIQKRLDNLTKQMEDLKQQTQKSDLSNENQKEDLNNQQKETTENLKNLEDKMKELQEKMQDFKDMPNDQMEKAMEELQKQQNQELSKDAQQQLMKGQKQQAQQSQSQLSQNMQKMQEQMSSLQQQMQSQNQKQVFNDMMKVLDNLLTLSKEQEELKNKTQKLDANSPLFNENAKKQNNLERGMDKILSQLNELGQKTFAITPEMAKALGDAKRSMQQSTYGLQNRSGSMASMQQGQAMGSLNEAATLMKGAMESMMNGGGSGGGMPSLMQQLQQLGPQQMNLNNLTQMLNQGQFSMQQQAELQRLAQQQEMIRKSLEELNNEAKQAGETKKLPANLDKILSEMQEVVADMKTQKLNDELVQKQEKILSKLLDAQRSINERDFEKQRESKSGDTFARQSPADLNLSIKRKDKIKDELNKAVQEGYAKDYENLIRKYYEALEKEKINN